MNLKVKKIVEHKYFHNFIISLIIINGITLGLETSKDIFYSYHDYFIAFDSFVITVFTIEIVLRMYAYGKRFFKDAWSLFDLIIVIISLAPANAGFEIFRILRVLRLFRLITVVPQMRKIVSALLGVIPGMLSIASLLILFFYIFAIIATHLFGEDFPQWFGDLGESFYTLFQVMTLESWSMGIARPIMEVHPHAWIFFLVFIFMATFIMINLIVAVVVDAMSDLSKKEKSSELTKIEELKKEVQELKELLKQSLNK